MLRLCAAERHVEFQSGDSRQAAPGSLSDPESVRVGNHCCSLSDGQAHPYLQQSSMVLLALAAAAGAPPCPAHKLQGGAPWCRCGPMVDLCTGPHLPSTGFLKAQAVSNLSRAFWRADAKKDPLQVRHWDVTTACVSAVGLAALLVTLHATLQVVGIPPTCSP